ncbi:MAG: hypothetical protein JWM95_4535 [Gemmatimonadetes bacterium]|nr:hypothetical protein [Gemmatimonadota bacterium]
MIAAAMVAMLAIQASSAQSSTARAFELTASAGPSKVIGITGDNLNWGYTAGGALDFRIPDTRFGLRAEASYSSYNFRAGKSLVSDAKFSDLGLNLDLVSWAAEESGSDLRPYITLGPSISRLTSSSTIASSSYAETHAGFNVGLGVDKPIGALALRFDVRFRQLSLNGDTFKAIPITVGLQF